MKVKTAELDGLALDWAVAKCEGLDYYQPSFGPSEPEYSTDWAQGGPIIDREFICLNGDDGAPGAPASWEASIFNDGETCQSGPTALIAAMRCYVAGKLGESVEVPEELFA